MTLMKSRGGMNKYLGLAAFLVGLAAVAWESLVRDPGAARHRGIDPEGIDIAAQRDTDIEFGQVQPSDHAEFFRRTIGVSECHGF